MEKRKGAPASRGTSKRRREGDLLGDLRSRLERLENARTPIDEEARENELVRFLDALTEEEKKAIRKDYMKLTLGDRKRIHRGLSDLGGSFGAGAPLVRGILDDEKARIDALPAPQEVESGLSEADWHRIFLGLGHPEAEAQALAAEETSGTPDDHLRRLYAKHGMPPEMIETTIVETRRNEKWRAVADATLSAELAAKERKRKEELRPLVEEAAKLSADLQKTAGELAWRLEHIAIDRIGIDRRDSGNQEAAAWAELQSTVSEGGSFADVLWAVSQMAEAVAGSLGNLGRELSKPAGGQESRDARQAAKVLRTQGLTHQQIAYVLAKRALVPDTYSAENVRDLLRKTPEVGEPDDPGKVLPQKK